MTNWVNFTCNTVICNHQTFFSMILVIIRCNSYFPNKPYTTLLHFAKLPSKGIRVNKIKPIIKIKYGLYPAPIFIGGVFFCSQLATLLGYKTKTKPIINGVGIHNNPCEQRFNWIDLSEIGTPLFIWLFSFELSLSPISQHIIKNTITKYFALRLIDHPSCYWKRD